MKMQIGIAAVLVIFMIGGVLLYQKTMREIDGIVLKDLDSIPAMYRKRGLI